MTIFTFSSINDDTVDFSSLDIDIQDQRSYLSLKAHKSTLKFETISQNAEYNFAYLYFSDFINRKGVANSINVDRKLNTIELISTTVVIDQRFDILNTSGVTIQSLHAFIFTIVRNVFWSDQMPRAIIHLCHPSLYSYIIKEWSRYIDSIPMSFQLIEYHDIIASKTISMVSVAQSSNSFLHPKQRIRRMIQARWEKLKFWK
jgi:hypothetical protein